MGILKGLVKVAGNMSGLGLVKRQLGPLLKEKKKAPVADTSNPAARTYESSWDDMAKANSRAARSAESSMLDQDAAERADAQRIKRMRTRRLAGTQGK